MKIVDTRGLVCPAPLIKTRQGLVEAGADEPVRIIIDNPTSLSNVKRYLTDNKLRFSVAEEGGATLVTVVGRGVEPKEGAGRESDSETGSVSRAGAGSVPENMTKTEARPGSEAGAGSVTEAGAGSESEAGAKVKTVAGAGDMIKTEVENKVNNIFGLKGNPEDYCSTSVKSEPGKKNTVVAITSDKMGSGDDELGTKLMISFFRTLVLLEPAPASVVFYNSGVKLALDDSPVHDKIKELAEMGTGIYLCTTCINHFGIKDRLPVGNFSDMYQILNILKDADNIIRP